MRKGEQTKQQMVAAAEELFLTRGYEATSVQDILDVVHGSKGGFYHHFESKDDVLKLLCAQHAQKAATEAMGSLNTQAGDAVKRLSLLLQAAMPLRLDNTPFLSLLLPMLDRQESVAVRVTYQQSLAECFQPLLQAEIDRAVEEKLMYTRVPGAAAPVMLLTNECWLQLALCILRGAQKGQVCDSGALLDILKTWRKSVELMLEAPFGSIELLPIQDAEEAAIRLTEMYHQHSAR